MTTRQLYRRYVKEFFRPKRKRNPSMRPEEKVNPSIITVKQGKKRPTTNDINKMTKISTHLPIMTLSINYLNFRIKMDF